MGFASWSGINKIWERNKPLISERIAPRGGEIGKAYRNVRGTTANMAEGATTSMESVGLDKPGSDVKRFTDWAKNVSGKAELIAWGSNSTDNNSSSGAANPEDLLYGSRRGIQGRRKSGKSNSEDLRRTPYAMKNDTLLTQGQKAKKLKGKV